MLKLNSNYARSYLAEKNMNDKGGLNEMSPEKMRSGCYKDVGQKDMYMKNNEFYQKRDKEDQWQYHAHGYDKTFGEYPKNNRFDTGYGDPIYGDEYQNLRSNMKQNNYYDQLNGNREKGDISPRQLNKRNQCEDNFKLKNRLEENQENNYRGYSAKYSGKNSYQADDQIKVDYQIKHSRRNQEIKNRLRRQCEESSAYSNQNCSNLRQTNKNNPVVYQQSEYQRFSTKNQKNIYDNIPNKFENYKHQPDRNLINENKNLYSNNIQHTPQKMVRQNKFEPGSSERKKSLIEKSNQLQQKLKRLNSQYPSPLPNRQKIVSQTNSVEMYQNRLNPRGNSNYEPFKSRENIEISNEQSYTPKYQQRNIKATIGNMQRDNFIQNNYRQNGTSENAIEKISKLNQKINERIQSIITNFSKK